MRSMWPGIPENDDCKCGLYKNVVIFFPLPEKLNKSAIQKSREYGMALQPRIQARPFISSLGHKIRLKAWISA